jgi:hypothetical protein
MLGAYLWVTGQQVGSLSCTGPGYWVVFDWFGVALKDVLPKWLTPNSASGSVAEERVKIRRRYEFVLIVSTMILPSIIFHSRKGRVETVSMFAQAVSFCLRVQGVRGARVIECGWRRGTSSSPRR